MIGAARRAMLFEKELLSMNQGEKQNLGESINAFIAKSNPSPMMNAEFFARRRLRKGRKFSQSSHRMTETIELNPGA